MSAMAKSPTADFMTPPMPIYYLLVEDDESVNRHSVFHLLRHSEFALLRCFMALLHLPVDANHILGTGRPFLEAFARFREVPAFRKTLRDRNPAPALLDDAMAAPILCVLGGRRLPPWLPDLADARSLILLSEHDTAIDAAGQLPRVSTGWLHGLDDLRSFYLALQAVCEDSARDTRFADDVRTRFSVLAASDLLSQRSRLPFIPPVALPQPSRGRPAAYLLNRLSNNVDRPVLQGSDPADSAERLPRILRFALLATSALAMVELDDGSLADFPIDRERLVAVHSEISGASDPSAQFKPFIELGTVLAGGDTLGAPFVTVPAARSDLIRGRVPDGVTLEAGHRGMIKPGLRALADLSAGISPMLGKPSDTDDHEYGRARETLLLEQRLLACESAILASRSGSVPFLASVGVTEMFTAIDALNRAISSGSKKVSTMFREVERGLAKLLPQYLLSEFAQGNSRVQLLSDLPLEWTMVDEWPLCLTRPVSRIPMGVTHWDVLAAALEASAPTIDTRVPSRTLIVDLIPAHDKIRQYSDSFARISNELAQHYTYSTPHDAAAFRELLAQVSVDIVVIDTHGQYDRSKDQLWLGFPSGAVLVEDLLPEGRIPPVWVLSACSTSVTGAMRGCFVRRLLAQGAACVVATQAPVDALTAEIFVGRLLTELYNPITPHRYDDFGTLFFATQFTTALLYDPLLPMIRRAKRDPELRKRVGAVLGAYFAWTREQPIPDVRRFRREAAWFLGSAIAQAGLTELVSRLEKAGQIRPETLLFSVFGVPSEVRLVS
jgi:hypothetical protein